MPQPGHQGDGHGHHHPAPAVAAEAFMPQPGHQGDGHGHHHPAPQAGHHHAEGHPRALGILAVWRRLLGMVRPWWLELVFTFLLGLAHHGSVIGVGVVSALLVGTVITGGDLTLLLILLAVLTPLAAFFVWTESWAAHDLAYRLLAEMRVDIYKKLDPLAPAYMVRRRSGDLVSIVGGDVETVEFFFAHTITPAFVAVLAPVRCWRRWRSSLGPPPWRSRPSWLRWRSAHSSRKNVLSTWGGTAKPARGRTRPYGGQHSGDAGNLGLRTWPGPHRRDGGQ